MKRLIYILLSTLCIASACKKEIAVTESPDLSVQEDPASLYMKVRINLETPQNQTKASVDGHVIPGNEVIEYNQGTEVIDKLIVQIYDMTDSAQTGGQRVYDQIYTFQHDIRENVETITEGRVYEITFSKDDIVNFKIGNTYRFVFILPNAGYAYKPNQPGGDSYTNVTDNFYSEKIKKYSDFKNYKFYNLGNPDTPSLPLIGFKDLEVSNFVKGSKTNPYDIGDLNLIRAYSKVELKINKNQAMREGIDIVGMRICNARKVGTLIPGIKARLETNIYLELVNQVGRYGVREGDNITYHYYNFEGLYAEANSITSSRIVDKYYTLPQSSVSTDVRYSIRRNAGVYAWDLFFQSPTPPQPDDNGDFRLISYIGEKYDVLANPPLTDVPSLSLPANPTWNTEYDLLPTYLVIVGRVRETYNGRQAGDMIRWFIPISNPGGGDYNIKRNHFFRYYASVSGGLRLRVTVKGWDYADPQVQYVYADDFTAN